VQRLLDDANALTQWGGRVLAQLVTTIPELAPTDTALGVSYNAATGNALSAYYDSITHQHAARASLSYVTGSHAVKAGYVEQFGTWQRNQFSYTDYIVRLNNGAPTSVVLSATPQNASYDMNAEPCDI
jgi:hypothetical protein